MIGRQLASAGMVMLLAGAPMATAARAQDRAALQQQVRSREEAFARTMTDRDLRAFSSFLSQEAVFVGRSVSRGSAAITEAWKRFFDGPAAPFSWRPETVEVLDSGTLALSSGPVFGPDGKRIGTFNSTWRREPDGVWRIVLDNGCP